MGGLVAEHWPNRDHSVASLVPCVFEFFFVIRQFDAVTFGIDAVEGREVCVAKGGSKRYTVQDIVRRAIALSLRPGECRWLL